MSLSALLRKTEHYDKDERYMAASDICTLLQRHAATINSNQSTNNSSSSRTSPYPSSIIHGSSNLSNIIMDLSTERRICSAIIALLDDSSNDVQTITVKTLGVLLTIVQEEQAIEICNRLCTLVLDDKKSELRDVYAIGLRTLVKTVPSGMGEVVSQRLVGRLLEGIRMVTSRRSSTGEGGRGMDSEEDILLCCLDVLTDLLERFGASSKAIEREHERILDAALGLCLEKKSLPVVKKRASNTIAHLAVGVTDTLWYRLMEALLKRIEEETSNDVEVALIRTMCKISEKVGNRLAGKIDRIVPVFLRFCDPTEAIAADDDNMMVAQSVPGSNELRESCFGGFESFLSNCPNEVNPYLNHVIKSALAYMRYDPNYSYGEDDDQDEHEEPTSDDDDDYSNDEFSDDDVDDIDDSWKVRRSAVKSLTAVVECSRAEPSTLWTDSYPFGSKSKSVAAALLDRFKEREEECRIYIIECFTRLLSHTISASNAGTIVLACHGDVMDTTTDLDTKAKPVIVDLYTHYVPTIVKACEIQLAAKKGGERTKSHALSLLSTLCIAPQGIGGGAQITSVLFHIKLILEDPSSPKSLQLDALRMVRIMLENHCHEVHFVREGLAKLLPQLCAAVQEDWYKVIAEALRVLAEVPHFILPDDASSSLSPSSTASQIFDAIKPRLTAHDLDQEIKECALTAAANLLSHLHQYLTKFQLETLLQLTLERLKNETTRMAALKTLGMISSEARGLDLSIISPNAVAELASLLRQQNRALKQSALETLDKVIVWHGGSHVMDVDLYDLVLQEISGIIVDSDLHMSHLGLKTAISILKVCKGSAPSVKNHVVPPTLALCTSPLLQDLALESLLELLSQLVLTDAVNFATLHASLLSQLDPTHPPNKQAISNLAKCIATVTATAKQEEREATVNAIISNLESGTKTDLISVHLALLTSGELGRRVDLSIIASAARASAAQSLLEIYFDFFNSNSEETKYVAANALGQASLGAMSVFLPAILKALSESNQRKQYLLLSSLNELIKCHKIATTTTLSQSQIDQIMPHLLQHCSDQDEGIRTMVAECLGSLTCLQPASTLSTLAALADQHLSDTQPSTLIAWTIATAVKFAIAGTPPPTAALSPYLITFLAFLSSPNVSVRNAALIMVYSAVHHVPSLVAPVMRQHVLPSLYELAGLTLKRKVDLGPFKHTVDDALPLRKASLSIFATSLENCREGLDIPEFLPLLAKALADEEDVQLQAHQILVSLCHVAPKDVFQKLMIFVDPLEKTIWKKTKGEKTGTELERENEWVKSALRAMLALEALERKMGGKKTRDFFDRIKGNARFQHMLKAVAEEH